ncbi:hypothetical protein MGYG_08943, partial [Nannizzia gypsea CBS 118893]
MDPRRENRPRRTEKQIGSQGTTLASVALRDYRGVTRTQKVTFVIIPMVDIEVILGKPWLEEVNPRINWREHWWHYPHAVEWVATPEPDECGAPATVQLLLLTLEEKAVGKNQIPREFESFADVFSEEAAYTLADPGLVSHEIELVEGKVPPHLPLYNLSAKELQVLREYLDTMLKRGWIRESKSPAGAPLLFAPKADGSLRTCVDYRGLNKMTIKNRLTLPRVDEMLDRLAGAMFFTKLDLREAYHRVRIKEGDEWKTAFRTRYGHYEYLVMPFGLANAPATFQGYINRVLTGLVDIACIVYLDDILIFSASREKYIRHIKLVLDRLRKYRLYAKLSKCAFFQVSVDFLGYRVSRGGVSMDPTRVTTVQEWPEPCSFHDIQVFLGFANFYRRFIRRYSHIVTPITELLKGSQGGKKKGKFTWTPEASKAFRELKDKFLTGPLLQHFDPSKPIRVETDASTFACGAVLSQPYEEEGRKPEWHPVAFWSKKLDDTQKGYGTPDQEMLAIVKSFEQWRHYLEGAQHTVQVLTDHHNLQGFMKQSKKVSHRRQVNWLEQLAAYDFEIVYRTGKTNPAD